MDKTCNERIVRIVEYVGKVSFYFLFPSYLFIPFRSIVLFDFHSSSDLFYFMLFHFRCLCVCFFIVFFVLLHSHRDFVCFRLFSIFFAVVYSFCWFYIAYSALFAYLSFIRLQYSYVKTKKNKILWKLLLIVFNISFLKRYTNIAHAANGRAIATNRPFSSFKYACCRWIWYKFVCVFIVHHFVGSVFHDMAHSQFIL